MDSDSARTMPMLSTDTAMGYLLLKGASGKKYELLSFVGRGGMAEVHLARESGSGVIRAVKMLPGGGASEAARKRFLRESCAAASLLHPNIVRIYDVSLEQHRPFIVMEYLDGGSLAEVIHAHPSGMPQEEVLETAMRIADALAHAHSRNIIHRDIKPSNVLFDSNGAPKLSDFGLARSLDVETLTESGLLLGTPAYMSPEQARGRKIVDPRSDVYSFGVMLYEMLTGRLPFEADDPLAVCHMHAYDAPSPPSALRPDLNPQLEKVILKCLEKSPDYRYQSMEELKEDVGRVAAGGEVEYVPPASDEAGGRASLEAYMGGPHQGANLMLVGAACGICLWIAVNSLLHSFHPMSRTPASPAGSAPRTAASRPVLSRSAMLSRKPASDAAPISSAVTGENTRRLLSMGYERIRKLDLPLPVKLEVGIREQMSEGAAEERRNGRVLLVLPLEDRTATRSGAHLCSLLLQELDAMGIETIPPRRLEKWKRRHDVTFAELFSRQTLHRLARDFGASYFVTGALLRRRRRPAGTSLEYELRQYDMKTLSEVESWRENICAPDDFELERRMRSHLERIARRMAAIVMEKRHVEPGETR